MGSGGKGEASGQFSDVGGRKWLLFLHLGGGNPTSGSVPPAPTINLLRFSPLPRYFHPIPTNLIPILNVGTILSTPHQLQLLLLLLSRTPQDLYSDRSFLPTCWGSPDTIPPLASWPVPDTAPRPTHLVELPATGTFQMNFSRKWC